MTEWILGKVLGGLWGGTLYAASMLPMGAWWFIAAVVVVMVSRIPIFGSIKTGIAAGGIVMLLAYSGQIFAKGYEWGDQNGYERAYKEAGKKPVYKQGSVKAPKYSALKIAPAKKPIIKKKKRR
jgi:hypothetical protein